MHVQITLRVKQCITYQRTHYHDTTTHTGYRAKLELSRSRDIRAANKHIPKYCKSFVSPLYILLYQKKKKRFTFQYIKLSRVSDRSRGQPEAPFSIATTPRCRGERYSFTLMALLYPWYLPYNTVLSKAASSTIFWVFGMIWPGMEPWSPELLVNTLLTWSMGWLCIILERYIYWKELLGQLNFFFFFFFFLLFVLILFLILLQKCFALLDYIP